MNATSCAKWVPATQLRNQRKGKIKTALIFILPCAWHFWLIYPWNQKRMPNKRKSPVQLFNWFLLACVIIWTNSYLFLNFTIFNGCLSELNTAGRDASEMMKLLFWLDEFNPSALHLFLPRKFPGEKCNEVADTSVYYHDNDSWWDYQRWVFWVENQLATDLWRVWKIWV